MEKSDNNNIDIEDLDKKYFKTEKVASLKNLKSKLKWNKEEKYSYL